MGREINLLKCVIFRIHCAPSRDLGSTSREEVWNSIRNGSLPNQRLEARANKLSWTPLAL